MGHVHRLDEPPTLQDDNIQLSSTVDHVAVQVEQLQPSALMPAVQGIGCCCKFVVPENPGMGQLQHGLSNVSFTPSLDPQLLMRFQRPGFVAVLHCHVHVTNVQVH